MKKNVIIDTDPGGDDTVAILLAYKLKKLDIKGITTVAGNETVDQCTENVLKILEYVGADQVPVAKGCAEPLIRSFMEFHFHGRKGMGNVELPEPQLQPVEKHAVNFIIDKAKELGDLTLLAFGPLTNIASALAKDPSIKESINEISLMGGAFNGRGNATPTGEYNVIQDPEAAKIVFESGIPLKIAPIDATHKLATKDLIPGLEDKETKAAELAYRVIKGELEWVKSKIGVTPVSNDSLAVYLAMDREEGVDLRKVAVEVETKGEFTYGQTLGDFRKNWKDIPTWAGLYSKDGMRESDIGYLPSNPPLKPNAEVCVDLKPEKVNRFIVETLTSKS